jgi:hypothetical protein
MLSTYAFLLLSMWPCWGSAVPFRSDPPSLVPAPAEMRLQERPCRLSGKDNHHRRTARTGCSALWHVTSGQGTHSRLSFPAPAAPKGWKCIAKDRTLRGNRFLLRSSGTRKSHDRKDTTPARVDSLPH